MSNPINNSSGRRDVPANERRNSPRRRTLLAGRIIFNQQSSVINCMVRNVSESGARLEVEPSIHIPDKFELDVPSAGITMSCRIIWRRGNLIGVSRE